MRRKLMTGFLVLIMATAMTIGFGRIIEAGTVDVNKVTGEVVKATQTAVTIKDEKGKLHKLRLSRETKVEGELKPGAKVEAILITTKVVKTQVKSISIQAPEMPVPTPPAQGQAPAPVPSAPEAPKQQ